MDSDLSIETDDAAPSYEESMGIVYSPPSAASKSSKLTATYAPASSLTQTLSNVRASRIDSIIEQYIAPLLQEQASRGLHQMDFVLVPSNESSLQPATLSGKDVIEGVGSSISTIGEELVIGFDSSAYVKLIRLHGPEYAQEFWQQQLVRDELLQSLKMRLEANGVRMQEPGVVSMAASTRPVLPPAGEPEAAKKGFWSRKTKEEKATNMGMTSFATTWLSNGQQQQQQHAVQPGHASINVEIREVSLRVTTDMGLYETRRGNAVVIKAEFGG